MRHKALFVVALAAVIGLLTTGCDQLWQTPKLTFEIADGGCGDPTVVRLMAGQHFEAGSITVWNCDENLCVRYETTGDWLLTETHLAVATSLEGIPQTKKGSPKIGRFPYKAEHDPAVAEYTYCIPLGEWEPGTTLYIAAHAVVERPQGKKTQEETGWGEGEKFPKSWAMWFTHTVQECDTNPVYIEEGEPEKVKGYAVRFRSFGNTGGDEMYLGVGDLGFGANRVARDFGYSPWGSSNAATFTYDDVNDKLVATVNTGSRLFTLEYPNLAANLLAKQGLTPADIDFLIIAVVGRDAGCTVELNDVYINGFETGDFDGTGGWNTWTVTGVDFTTGFTVTGNIELSGSFGGSQERSKVELLLGSYVE